MRKSPYYEIGGPGGHLANLEDFRGESMSGEWRTYSDGYSYYVVRSYSTTIAAYRPPDPKSPEKDLYTEFWLTDRDYSVTTSHHKSLVRAWLGHASPSLRDISL